MKKVLLADDEPEIVELLSFNFRSAGFEVKSAGDGLQALEQAHQFQPDLITLDLMLPDVDGFGVCEMLRRAPATSGIPIIMLTAWANEQSRLLGLELGADDYVVKPFSPLELVPRAKRLLQRCDASSASFTGS